MSFFGDPFDFNGDGKVDPFEMTLELMMFDDFCEDENTSDESDDSEDDD